ncbi:MAG: amidohydrolase family protein [Myxococcales bacterium]|nr:amidohydrolase family protein [Myxococcota bacterium]MDW8281610.1 amidohydrolase family protein [Myxococcales bacterium]
MLRLLLLVLLVCLLPWMVPGCQGQDHELPEEMEEEPRSGPCGSPPVPAPGQRCAVRPGAGPGLLLRGTVLLPDRVLSPGEVLIGADGRIRCVHSCCADRAGSVPWVHCPEGVISPGLINAHDHIGFTKSPPVAHGDLRYDHRHEWRRGVPGNPDKPRLTVPGGANAQALQWGELRQVLAGTTSLVGAGQGAGVLRNLDTTAQEGLREVPVEADTFPLGDAEGFMTSSGCAYPRLRQASTLAGLDAYLPHIAEGVSAAARNELVCLSSFEGGGQDLLGPITGIVHAVAITAEDARMLAARRTGVVWSPRSNIDLYGHTAPIPLLDRAGVLLALGTDWTATGSMNLLRELRCADELNRTYFAGHLSDQALWQMVTLNAALMTGTADVLGQIKVGHVADLAVFWGPEGKGAHAAVVRAELPDVLLTLRGGLPLYGEAELLAALGHGDGQGCELLQVCGTAKRLCAERETGRNLAMLEAQAGRPLYPLLACGTPPMEPSCVPARRGEFGGQITAEDPDGDGLVGTSDNCPNVFNPPRPMDRGVQPDSDGDGLGDVCDPCPLDRDLLMCMPADPRDRDADGIADHLDNCPGLANTDQADTDMDGRGDACDACPMVATAYGEPCPFTVRQLRDPMLGMRPRRGTEVSVRDLLVVAVRDKRGFGFHARDLEGPQDYAGILVFTGGMGPPRATDGTPLEVGHVVQVRGTFGEFHRQDQIDNVLELRITGRAEVVPRPIRQADLLGGGERLESLLVRLENLTMQRQVPPPMGAMGEDDFWASEDPMATCAGDAPPCVRIGDFLLDGDKADMQPPFVPGGLLRAVVGVVSGFRDLYSIEVRSAADIFR